jgi:hypothetical protein
VTRLKAEDYVGAPGLANPTVALLHHINLATAQYPNGAIRGQLSRSS